MNGQSDINERLNKTNANLSSGIAHLSSQKHALAQQVHCMQTQNELLEGMILTLHKRVDEMKQAFITPIL